ncbi:hypothetical protein E2542_SST06462 [Spatholobus suberectus]|nr:hypothetical protein E2542_SST06462 [Spatholobus suberectus]
MMLSNTRWRGFQKGPRDVSEATMEEKVMAQIEDACLVCMVFNFATMVKAQSEEETLYCCRRALLSWLMASALEESRLTPMVLLPEITFSGDKQ